MNALESFAAVPGRLSVATSAAEALAARQPNSAAAGDGGGLLVRSACFGWSRCAIRRRA
jgi:hypothetical protein